MSVSQLSAVLLGVNKHKIVGTGGIIAGVAVVALGALKVIKRTAGALFMATCGLAILIVGVLLYTKVI